MAKATSTLQIIIDVLGDDAAKKVSGIKDQFDKLVKVWGTIGVAAVATKKALDFAKEGAQLQLVANQFKNVAENAGYAADVLLNEMRSATGGLVSDAELIQSGLDIISLGLADSQDGIVTLAKAVSVLGLDMQQVILTFANNSIARLDSLGLSVENVKKRTEELNAEGFDGDAFDQAVLEGLIERMEILGDTSETTAGDIAQLETNVTNLLNAAKQVAAEGIAPVVGAMADALDVQNTYNEALATGVISQHELNNLLVEEREGWITQAEILAIIADRQRMAANEAREYQLWQEALNQEISFAGNIHNTYAERARSSAQANVEAGSAAAEASRQFDDQAESLTIAGKAYSDISTSVFSLTQSLQDQLDFLTAGGGALLELAQTAQQALDEGNFEGAQAALDAAAEGAIDLDLELGKITADEAIARMEELGNPPEVARQKVEELQSTLFALTSRDYVINVRTQFTGGGSLPIAGAPSMPSGEIEGAAMQSVDIGNVSSGASPVVIESMYVDVADGTDFLATLSNIGRNAGRDAASARAGSAYIGQ